MKRVLVIVSASEDQSQDTETNADDDLMSSSNRNILKGNQLNLIERMDPDHVFILLDSWGILTTKDIQDIKSGKNGNHSSDRVQRLLEILINHKTNKAFRLLIKALEQTNQSQLAKLLRK